MNQKQRQRFGSAIACTILSCAAWLLAGVDKAQAAVLTYNFQVENSNSSGFFKVEKSSLTAIGNELITVSKGRLNTNITASFPGSNYQLKGKNYYNLVGATVSFDRWEFRGLQARGYDSASREVNISSDEPGEPYYIKYAGSASWNMADNGPFSLFWGMRK
ncbi:hypothetical protein [Microcoleus sp.]|uniref:hypothetical protein n=1 Tax=Microcoleus sp. TaxID=44472 RepID=UPI003C78501A